MTQLDIINVTTKGFSSVAEFNAKFSLYSQLIQSCEENIWRRNVEQNQKECTYYKLYTSFAEPNL